MSDKLSERAYSAAMTLYNTDPAVLVKPTRDQFAYLDDDLAAPTSLKGRVAEQRRLMDGRGVR